MSTVTIAGRTFEAPTSFALGGKTYAKADGTPWNQADFDRILDDAAANIRRDRASKSSTAREAALDTLYDRAYGSGVTAEQAALASLALMDAPDPITDGWGEL